MGCKGVLEYFDWEQVYKNKKQLQLKHEEIVFDYTVLKIKEK